MSTNVSEISITRLSERDLVEKDFYAKWRKHLLQYNYERKVHYPDEYERDKNSAHRAR